jgi:hypothetical protein
MYRTASVAASQASMRESDRTTSKNETARVEKPTSRRNGPRLTVNGLMIHIDPTTHDTMNVAAPSSSPIARPPDWALMAENVEKTSGLPFPNARNVTPATFSSSPSSWAMVARFGVKKSEALIPRVENRKMSQVNRERKTNGRILGSAQKYDLRYGIARMVSDS